MTRLVGIDHVQVGMPAGGEEKARAFYGGVLGLIEVTKPPQLAGRGGVWFAADGVALHLGVETDFRAAARAHTAFVVEDLDTLRQQLTGAGMRPSRTTADCPCVAAMCTIPSGTASSSST